jgi:hypothetical protein
MPYRRRSESLATNIKIFIDFCNLVRFDCVNKHAVWLWLPDFTQITSCCNLVAPVLQLSSNSKVKTFFRKCEECSLSIYLASRSCFTCRNEFRDTFPDSPVPNNWQTSRLVNRFRDTGTLHRVGSDMKRVYARVWTWWDISNTYYNIFVLFQMSV